MKPWLQVSFATALISATSIFAADSVRITLKPGLPLGGVSVASAGIYVTRPIRGDYREVEIDRYFKAIQTELTAIGPGQFCTAFAPDIPVVAIQIEIDGTSRALQCTLSTGTSLTYSTLQDRAFNRILDLTLAAAPSSWPAAQLGR